MIEHAIRAAALACVMALGGCGLAAPSRSEGYADLGSLGLRDVDRTFSISIGPTLLRLAARHIDDDPELRAMLRELDGVRVRIYEIDGDPARVAGRLERMVRNLQADGWEPVILVRDGSETTQMLVRQVHARIRGITLLSSDAETEVLVINLMGEIRPERFSEVMVALEVDSPDVRVAEAVN